MTDSDVSRSEASNEAPKHFTDVTSFVKSKELEKRRKLLIGISLFSGTVVSGLLGVPVLGFLFMPLLRKVKPVWRNVGPVSKFKAGDTVLVKFMDASSLPWSGMTAETAAWVRHKKNHKFEAFCVNCTHLGCPVRWMPDAKLFLCPCHGGVFLASGAVAAGPPPKPLHKYKVRVLQGQVQLLTRPIPITTS